MKLNLTEAAVEDLRSIRAFTLHTWGDAQEQIYLDRLWSKFQSILDNPEAFALHPDLFPDCRIATEGKHVIVFRVRGKVLEVVRVLHSAMDFKRHLPE